MFNSKIMAGIKIDSITLYEIKKDGTKVKVKGLAEQIKDSELKWFLRK